ncbi:MAG: phosphohistidine phosphatase SixA [Gammaproteobacteria bacterium]|nr:phosphohistidine phosphatase SixA [Gammaproteobacteria bacterium]
MNLYLVQHGQAVTKEVDPGRPLSPQGEQEIKRMAVFLEKSGVSVDRILHSGKMRAHQTAEILADKLLLKGEIEAIAGINPNDSVEDFAGKLHKLKHDTMLVGHLPFMARLVAYLTSGNADHEIVDYRPGSIVCLELDAEQNWRIRWMLRPDLIK